MQLHGSGEVEKHVSQIRTFIRQFVKNRMGDQFDRQFDVPQRSSKTRAVTRESYFNTLRLRESTISLPFTSYILASEEEVDSGVNLERERYLPTLYRESIYYLIKCSRLSKEFTCNPLISGRRDTCFHNRVSYAICRHLLHTRATLHISR